MRFIVKGVTKEEKTCLLESGKYIISFQIVDCDEKALEKHLQMPESERDWSQMRLSTILYFKSSFNPRPHGAGLIFLGGPAP